MLWKAQNQREWRLLRHRDFWGMNYSEMNSGAYKLLQCSFCVWQLILTWEEDKCWGHDQIFTHLASEHIYLTILSVSRWTHPLCVFFPQPWEHSADLANISILISPCSETLRAKRREIWISLWKEKGKKKRKHKGVVCQGQNLHFNCGCSIWKHILIYWNSCHEMAFFSCCNDILFSSGCLFLSLTLRFHIRFYHHTKSCY